MNVMLKIRITGRNLIKYGTGTSSFSSELNKKLNLRMIFFLDIQ